MPECVFPFVVNPKLRCVLSIDCGAYFQLEEGCSQPWHHLVALAENCTIISGNLVFITNTENKLVQNICYHTM